MEEVTYSEPINYSPNNVVYWEPKSKELKVLKDQGNKTAGALLTKAKKFIENGCIAQTMPNIWVCKPLKNYNKTTYLITHAQDGFNCDCQGFNKKLKEYKEGVSENKPICSHIVGVYQYCFLEAKNA